MKTVKLLIIGLDAATLDLINPWVAEGKLPNIAHLMSAGASGRLASIVPPITPPAWTSFMTGKNPGKHGIFDFLETQPGTYSQRYVNASSRRTKTIWRMLNEAGYTVGTMNVPFTYPPEHLDGFQISGMATPPETSPFVYPPELRGELEGCLGRFRLDVRYLGFMSTNPRRHQVLDDMKNLDDQWLRASLYLIEKHPADVMMFTFMSIDTVQHHFWQYMDPTHHYHDPSAVQEFGDAVFRVYQWLDSAVARMVEKVSPDTPSLSFPIMAAAPPPIASCISTASSPSSAFSTILRRKTLRSQTSRRVSSAGLTISCAAPSAPGRKSSSQAPCPLCGNASKPVSPRPQTSTGHGRRPSAAKCSPHPQASGSTARELSRRASLKKTNMSRC